jgi:hypothetical protein
MALVALCLSLAGQSCARAPAVRPTSPAAASYTSSTSERYRDASRWLCRADLPGGPCHADLSATELRKDGSRGQVPHVSAQNPAVDCFYVYPTVDMSPDPGNHEEFSDLSLMTDATVAQAARFSEVCSLYVPLYRQVTVGTYFMGDERREPYFATAFSDVADAFMYYLAHYNRGRKIALLGHSQGADMVVRLLQRFFDNDAALRARLLIAMPIGGSFETPAGRTAGGTLQNIPVCTAPDQPSCVVAYRTHVAGAPIRPAFKAPDGHVTTCVNPAGFEPGPHPFSRSYFPRRYRGGPPPAGLEDVDTPFVMLRDFYSGACMEVPPGYGNLAVTLPATGTDARQDLLNIDARARTTFGVVLGLHILDYQLPQGDLIELVRRRAPAAAP